MFYLDAASTAGYREVDDIIVDTMTNAMKTYWQNPSSLYAADVKSTINICRKQVADFIGAKPNEIYFTSGASESNNMAIRGWVDEELKDGYKAITVITTPIEHSSILKLVEGRTLDAHIRFCDVDEYGVIDYRSLKTLLYFCDDEPILVSVHMANNEIGTIQDIKRISEMVHKYGGVLHVDATQAFGHIPIDVEELGIDMMSASGHKISPVLKGIGFLYKKKDVDIQPLIYGSQENGLRGGTENTFGIVGLSKAIELCDISQEKIDDMHNKQDYFIRLLESKFGCKLNGSKCRLPNNINVTFPQGITGEALLYVLDMSNIKISTGSACNSKSIAPSHVLKGIGLTNEEAMKTVRFTLPKNITYEDVDYIVEEINKSIKIISM